MLAKYKNYSELQLWQEYSRLKAEWCRENGYADSKAYDAFILKITNDLGI